MTRYRECDVCKCRVNLPDGIDGFNFAGWGRHKGCCLCPDCNVEYVRIVEQMDNKKNEALNKFLKIT